jgi:hypothetical protein
MTIIVCIVSGLLVTLRKTNNIEKVTYHDGWFYQPPMDLDHYFFERLGMSKEKAADKELNNGGLNVNSSRCLKVESEPDRRPDENIIVLVDNINKESADKEDSITKRNGKTEENIQHNQNIVYNSGSVIDMKYKYITYQDYLNIPSRERLQYDLRDFRKYVGDELIRNHSVIKLFTKDSLLDPISISFIKLIYKVNLVFGINAMVYSDSIIDRIAYYNSKVLLFITLETYLLPFKG